MYKVHGFLDGKLLFYWKLDHLPRHGDTVRYARDRFAKVTEVIWCVDEEWPDGQRVNLRMEPLQDELPKKVHISGGSNPVDFPKFGGCPQRGTMNKDDRCATCTCWKSNDIVAYCDLT